MTDKIKKYFAVIIFWGFVFIPLTSNYSQGISPALGINSAPAISTPAKLVNLSTPFNPVVLKGIKINPKNGFELEFIIDYGDNKTANKEEIQRLLNYFLACLTMPEDDLWVNLSPYEKDRVTPDNLAVTDLGKDLLEQDYLLKQLSASLTYPESATGKKYWERVYQEAYKIAKTTKIPVDTMNKVWIAPQIMQVYEDKNAAIVTDAKLKVMAESDYLAMQKAEDRKQKVEVRNQKEENKNLSSDIRLLASKAMKEIIIPQIEKDVNSGANFVRLRQIYHAFILACWFKEKLRQSVYDDYIDKAKMSGIDLADKDAKEKIYQQYLDAYIKGVYNYIKKDYDAFSRKFIKRNYYSGGMQLVNALVVDGKPPVDMAKKFMGVATNLEAIDAKKASWLEKIQKGWTEVRTLNKSTPYQIVSEPNATFAGIQYIIVPDNDLPGRLAEFIAAPNYYTQYFAVRKSVVDDSRKANNDDILLHEVLRHEYLSQLKSIKNKPGAHTIAEGCLIIMFTKDLARPLANHLYMINNDLFSDDNIFNEINRATQMQLRRNSGVFTEEELKLIEDYERNLFINYIKPKATAVKQTQATQSFFELSSQGISEVDKEREQELQTMAKRNNLVMSQLIKFPGVEPGTLPTRYQNLNEVRKTPLFYNVRYFLFEDNQLNSDVVGFAHNNEIFVAIKKSEYRKANDTQGLLSQVLYRAFVIRFLQGGNFYSKKYPAAEGITYGVVDAIIVASFYTQGEGILPYHAYLSEKGITYGGEGTAIGTALVSWEEKLKRVKNEYSLFNQNEIDPIMDYYQNVLRGQLEEEIPDSKLHQEDAPKANDSSNSFYNLLSNSIAAPDLIQEIKWGGLIKGNKLTRRTFVCSEFYDSQIFERKAFKGKFVELFIDKGTIGWVVVNDLTGNMGVKGFKYTDSQGDHYCVAVSSHVAELLDNDDLFKQVLTRALLERYLIDYYGFDNVKDDLGIYVDAILVRIFSYINNDQIAWHNYLQENNIFIKGTKYTEPQTHSWFKKITCMAPSILDAEEEVMPIWEYYKDNFIESHKEQVPEVTAAPSFRDLLTTDVLPVDSKEEAAWAKRSTNEDFSFFYNAQGLFRQTYDLPDIVAKINAQCFYIDTIRYVVVDKLKQEYAGARGFIKARIRGSAGIY